jgi:hypothetical protein
MTRSIRWLLLGVLLMVAGALSYRAWQHGRPDWRGAAAERERATRLLGEHLARVAPGKHGLILANPFAGQPGHPREIVLFDDAGVRGLQASTRGTLHWDNIARPSVRPEFGRDPASVYIDPETTTPLSFLVTGAELDRILALHAQAQVVASLIGLPVDITRSAAWQKTSPIVFALVFPDFRLLGAQAEVQAAFKSGKILAAVLARPEPTPLGAAAPPVQDGSDRFLLVHAGNLDRVLSQYPKLF